MARIFAFVTFLCLITIIVMGLAAPNDPLFLFAATGPVALAARGGLAILMLALARGWDTKQPKLRSCLGLAGFVLISLGVFGLGATTASGVYLYLQPADLLTAVIVGITCSIVNLETAPAVTEVVADSYENYLLYPEESASSAAERFKAAPRHRHA